MKNLPSHRPIKLDPFWNAVLAGTIVSLIVLNILPSPKIQYLYRVKAVATQQRLIAFQTWLKQHPQKQGFKASATSGALLGKSYGDQAEGNIRFLSAEAIDSSMSSNVPVLSTNQVLPQRLLAHITFLSDARYRPEEIQRKLEEISFTQCKTQEVQELEREVRMLEWQRTSAEHLAAQLDESESSSLPLLTVSTNPAGNTSLLKDWKGIVEQKKQEQNDLIERLRTATTKAHGFIAVAGKPEVFPRIAKPLSASTIIAFAMGVVTACVYFLSAKYVQQGPSKQSRKTKSSKLQRALAVSKPGQGLRLAERLSKLGIPILGNIAASGDQSRIESSLYVVAGLDKHFSNEITERHEPDHAHYASSETAGQTGNASHPLGDEKLAPIGQLIGQRISVPLQRAIEWALVLWLAIGAMRFLTDDMWRGLFLYSPLTGLAKLLSVFV